jgi:hypothetical protein
LIDGELGFLVIIMGKKGLISADGNYLYFIDNQLISIYKKSASYTSTAVGNAISS